ncbi:Der1-like family domain containing protein [Amanita muscaria]
MDQFVAEIRKIPPVTRFLCFSSLGVTIPVLMKLVHPYKIIFIHQLVTKRMEIWRIFTSFFLGSGGINYVFELVMLYRTADQLESGPFARKSADFAWQLILVGGAIILACLPLGAAIFTRPLLVALTYLSSALAPPGAQTSLLGLLTLPVKFMPYIMIAMDFLMGGPAAAAQGIAGAVVGHLWWWTMWAAEGGQRPMLEAYARAPAWLRSLVGDGNGPVGGAGVHVIPPRQPAAARPRTGHSWGSGTRLGT